MNLPSITDKRKVDYSKLAGSYDEERFEGRKNNYNNLVYMRCLKSLLPRGKAINILDVGCGTGRGISFLALNGYNVIGLDYTMEMLGLCRKKIADVPSVSLIQGDSGDLPFSDESLDCVISLNFLHLFSIEVQKYFIDEMARILKPEGVLICAFQNYYRGLIAGKKTLKENPTLHLNRYSDFKYLFSNPRVKIDKIRGTSLPYLWRMFQYIPNIGKLLDVVAYVRPFSLIAHRLMVRALKIS